MTGKFRSAERGLSLGDRYADLSTPVSLLYSEHDWSRPAEREYVSTLLTDPHKITLPGCGHLSALERPGEMARVLAEFATLQSRNAG